MSSNPITFEARSFALLDVEKNSVLMTKWGNLAIFSVYAVAKQWADNSSRKIRVIPVTIKPITEQ